MDETEIKRKKVISILKIILILLVLLLVCTCFYKGSSYRSQVLKHIEKIGDNPTQNQIDEMFISGQYIYGDDPESAKLYFERVVEYEPRAAYYLSEYYYEKKDMDNYLKWAKNAGERGVGDAQFNLGVYYSRRNNIKESECWYLKAAEQNYMKAQYNLANLYIRQNKIEDAKIWYLKASELGSEEAKTELKNLDDMED